MAVFRTDSDTKIPDVMATARQYGVSGSEEAPHSGSQAGAGKDRCRPEKAWCLMGPTGKTHNYCLPEVNYLPPSTPLAVGDRMMRPGEMLAI